MGFTDGKKISSKSPRSQGLFSKQPLNGQYARKLQQNNDEEDDGERRHLSYKTKRS